jgi:hypothetical protein
MKKIIALVITFTLSATAFASGGMTCKTGDGDSNKEQNEQTTSDK